MIALLELVKGMELTPNSCVLCANNPVDEVSGEQQDAIFAPGVDVNWGDSVYICKSCGEIIADLLGRVPKSGFDKLQERHEQLKEKHEKLVRQHARARELLDRVKDGKQAEKQIRSTA